MDSSTKATGNVGVEVPKNEVGCVNKWLLAGVCVDIGPRKATCVCSRSSDLWELCESIKARKALAASM